MSYTSTRSGPGCIIQYGKPVTTWKEFYLSMKMLIQSWLENLTEDFYNMLLLLILFAGIVIVITAMWQHGAGSLSGLQNIYQGE